MASVSQMQAEANRQGAKAPADYPGGEQAWLADWYANAKAAGSIPSERADNYAGPNDAEAQGHNYSQNVSGSSGWKPGQSITPQQLRQLAQEQNFSEDYNRYSDAQLQAWIDRSWDPQAGKFRSEHGQEGHFEKPTECAPGTTLHGSKCVSWDQLPGELGGGGGFHPGNAPGPGGPAAPSGMQSSGDPLQDALVALYQERGGMFGGSDAGEALKGGGIWWGSQGAPLPMAPAAQAQAATQSIAQNQAQAPQPAPQPQANTSTISQPNTGENMLQKSLSSTLQAMPAPTRQVDPLVDQLRQTNKWWAGDRNSPLEA